MKILYIGWIGTNNTGDELMFDIFKEKYGQGNEITGKLCNEGFKDFEDYDLVCLGGGSILLEGYIDILYEALQQEKKVMVWGSAYDDLLGEDFIDRLENSNMPIYIYSDFAEEKLNEIAEKAEFFGVRGPLTYKILEKSNINMEKIVLSGDVGFLLKGKALVETGTILDFSKKDKVVAVNTGTSFNRVYGGKEELIQKSLVKSCKNLLKSGYKIYLYAMWHEDLDSMLDLYKNIDDSENVILDIVVHKGNELYTILQKCVFSINLKLHGNIISATAGVPFISLGYRLKAYDFVKSIDCEELNISTGVDNLDIEIDKKVKYIENNSADIIKKISEKIENYKRILEDVTL